MDYSLKFAFKRLINKCPTESRTRRLCEDYRAQKRNRLVNLVAANEEKAS